MRRERLDGRDRRRVRAGCRARRARRRAAHADAAAGACRGADLASPRGTGGDTFGVLDRGEPARRPSSRLDSSRPRDLRRMPHGGLGRRRPEVPVSLHELHRVRAALRHRARRPVRQSGDDDGAVPDVRTLPARVRVAGRPAVPRAGERLSRVRPDVAPGDAGRLSDRGARGRDRRGGPPAGRGRHRRRQGARRLAPRLRRGLRGRRRRASPAEAARGEAVRGDGPDGGLRGCVGVAGPRRPRPALLDRATDRARPRAGRRGGGAFSLERDPPDRSDASLYGAAPRARARRRPAPRDDVGQRERRPDCVRRRRRAVSATERRRRAPRA